MNTWEPWGKPAANYGRCVVSDYEGSYEEARNLGRGEEWLQQRVAELEAVIKDHDIPIKKRICLICGADKPCFLNTKETSGDPNWPGSPCTFDPTYRQLSDFATRLEAENAELRRDKERLDWLEQWCGVTVTGGALTRWSLFYDLVPNRPTYGSTFREAIDAAMAEGGE